MESGEKSFIIAKWIMIIGLLPVAYSLFKMMFLTFLSAVIIKVSSFTHRDLYDHHIIMEAISVFAFAVMLFMTFKRGRLKEYSPLHKISDRFMFGVYMIFVGHLGLGVSYALVVYIMLSPGGSASGIFFIPMILWMLLFYSIGFSIVSKEKLLDKFQEKNESESHT